MFDRINQRKKNKLHRSLPLSDPNHVDFTSNDYLDFTSLNEILPKGSFGSTGSRLISGNKPIHIQLEDYLASHYHSNSTILYATGYMANLGILSSIPTRHDIILFDQYSHASIKDGVRLSLAQGYSFKHNNIADLQNKLNRFSSKKIYVVTEAIFSMSGNLGKVKEILDLLNPQSQYLIVDEAHSTGIMGSNGAGYCQELGITNQVFARVHTFGKAIGGQGAIIATSNLVKDLLVNFSRSFIYSTAPAPIMADYLLKAHKYLVDHTSKTQKLLENSVAFHTLTKNLQLPNLSVPKSPIQCILIHGNKKLDKLESEFSKQGFLIKVIKSPTVPKGREIIRICIRTEHSQKEIEALISLINEEI